MFVFLALLLIASDPAVAQTELAIKALDPGGRVLPGVRFAYQGVESFPTNGAGVTVIAVPVAAGEDIKLDLPRSVSEEWILINSTVHAPASPREDPAEVVLMRRADFRAFAGEARDAVSQAPQAGGEISEDQQRQVLVEYAARHGLSEEQLRAAITAFGTTDDPIDQGIAAYLEGDYATAETALQEATTQQQSDFAEALRYLAVSQYKQGKYGESIATFRRAVTVRPEDSNLLGWLGAVLYESAEWTEAEPLMRRALEIDTAHFGPEHPEVVRGLGNLAQLLQETQRFDEAESLMRRALEISEANYGPEHSEVATSLSNLAMLLHETYRLGEAEPLMRRALEIDIAIFGHEHPEVAIDLNNLAQLLQDTDRVREAEPLMRRALEIDEASYGPEHPRVAGDLYNLALLLRATGRTEDVEALLRRALEIFETTLGQEHPNTQLVRESLLMPSSEIDTEPAEAPLH